MAKKLTDVKVLLQRVDDSSLTREVRDSMYKLRRFFSGDESALGRASNISISELGKRRKENSLRPDFRITGADEGVSNHALAWIRTLVKQVLIRHPEVEFKNLPISVSDFREAYVLDRMSRCEWVEEVRSSLLSFCIDGYAVIKTGMSHDYPAIRYVDPLDLGWDIHEKFPHKWRYVIQELRLNVSSARKELGDEVVNKIRANAKLIDETGEEVIKVLEYWDESTLAYISCGKPEVLNRKENPFGFIPFEIMHSEILPSHLTPVPLAVHVLGTQAAHTETQRSLIELARLMRPQVVVDPNAFTEESYRQWQLNPDELTVLVYKPGITEDQRGSAIQFLSPMQEISNVLAIKRELDEEFVRSLGVNPYSAGASISPEFASETQAIMGLSGLNAMDISQQLAEFLAKIFRKIVRIGYLYDEEPFIYKANQDVVEFGPDFPITVMLEDDVECMVQPSLQNNPEAAAAKAQTLATIFLSDPDVRTQHPALVKKMREMLLSAYNIRGADQLLAPPTDDEAKLQILKDVPVELVVQALQLLQQQQQPQDQAPMEGQPL
jgi:hypothetical protein